MHDYIKSLISYGAGLPDALYNMAKESNIPVIREDTAALLKVLIRMLKPGRILEAGTAIGFSAILMCGIAPDSCLIDTVEINPEYVSLARENIKKAGYGDRIHVIAGDMAEVFACLNMQYDVIFLDGAKSRYIDVYDDILRLLKIDGILICDNVVFYGKIYDEPEKAPHKHRTIVNNMRLFLEKLISDDRFESCILETGDGMTVSCRIK